MPMQKPAIQIRPVEKHQAGLLLTLIKELAEYERLSQHVHATESMIQDSLFGPHPAGEAVFAYHNGELAGFAYFFPKFATFAGRTGMYLEDLYVRPAYRKYGVGYAIMQHLAHITRKRGWFQMEWVVLDWNQPAIDFYHRLGATLDDTWRVFNLAGPALEHLAQCLVERATK